MQNIRFTPLGIGVLDWMGRMDSDNTPRVSIFYSETQLRRIQSFSGNSFAELDTIGQRLGMHVQAWVGI